MAEKYFSLWRKFDSFRNFVFFVPSLGPFVVTVLHISDNSYRYQYFRCIEIFLQYAFWGKKVKFAMNAVT